MRTVPIDLQAIPANPNPVKFTQPGGEVITIRNGSDENSLSSFYSTMSNGKFSFCPAAENYADDPDKKKLSKAFVSMKYGDGSKKKLNLNYNSNKLKDFNSVVSEPVSDNGKKECNCKQRRGKNE